MAPSDKMKRQEGPGITHLLKESKSNHSHKGKTLNRKKKTCLFHDTLYFEASLLWPPHDRKEKFLVTISCHLVTAFSQCIFGIFHSS